MLVEPLGHRPAALPTFYAVMSGYRCPRFGYRMATGNLGFGIIDIDYHYVMEIMGPLDSDSREIAFGVARFWSRHVRIGAFA